MEEHFLWTFVVRLSNSLLGGCAEEENMSMRVTGGDVEMVWTPLGVIDGAMTLGFNDIVMFEQNTGCGDVPYYQVTIVSP